jgi:hypothetical protein
VHPGAVGGAGRFENREEEGFDRSDGSGDGFRVPRIVSLLVAVGLPRARFAGRALSSLSAKPDFCRPQLSSGSMLISEPCPMRLHRQWARSFPGLDGLEHVFLLRLANLFYFNGIVSVIT